MDFKLLQTCNFKGIKIWTAKRSDFGTIDLDNAIHLIDPTQGDIEYSLNIAERDSRSNIICYELTDIEFSKQAPHYVTRL